MLNGMISAHIEAFGPDYNRENTIAAARRMGGGFVVVMNDLEAVTAALLNGITPAYRIKDGQFNDDDADKNIPDPIGYADEINRRLDVAEQHLPADLKKWAVMHGGNELGTGTATRTDSWLSRFVSRCTQHGRKAVVANWAYKNIPPALPLTVAALRKNGGWMGFHEGTYRGKPLAPDAYADGAIGGFIPWMLANPGVPVWITEFAGSYGPHEGWKTLYGGNWRLWRDQIAWAWRNVYRRYNVVGSLFTINKWTVGRDFEYIDVPEFMDAIAQLNQEFVYMTQPAIQPTPDPETLGEPVEMIVSDTVDLSANVRTGTNTSAAIITSVIEGDRVLARPQQTASINGYRWWNIRNKNGQPLRDAAGMPYTDGWIAHVATLTVPVVVEPPTVYIPVPHVSQLGTSATLKNNDCFNATAQGLALGRLMRRGLNMPLLNSVNWLLAASPLATDDNPVTAAEAQEFMDRLGIEYTYSDQLKAPRILAELEAGRPLILLGNYGHLNPADRKMGHWFTVIGYSPSAFIIHDPYKLGADVRISKGAMESAQTDLIAWNGNAFAGKPYQGYIIDWE